MCQQNCHFQKNPGTIIFGHVTSKRRKPGPPTWWGVNLFPTKCEKTGFLLVNITFYHGFFEFTNCQQDYEFTSNFLYSKCPVELLGKLHRKLNELCRFKAAIFFGRVFVGENLKKICKNGQSDPKQWICTPGRS